jgi:conjugal transfer ATP-binding protein TraC
MLEVMPQSGADERMAEVLISLYSTCPPGTGIQFHLFASPHLRDQLRRYANLRVEDTDQAEKAKHWGRPARNDNLFHRLARQRVGHLLQGRADIADRRLPLHDPRLPADDERGAHRPMPKT